MSLQHSPMPPIWWGGARCPLSPHPRNPPLLLTYWASLSPLGGLGFNLWRWGAFASHVAVPTRFFGLEPPLVILEGSSFYKRLVCSSEMRCKIMLCKFIIDKDINHCGCGSIWNVGLMVLNGPRVDGAYIFVGHR